MAKEISKINSSEPSVWFVTQGSTYTKEQGKKFLWAPSKGKDNRSRFYWDNLLKVRMGDLIFNYSEGLKGISIALTDGYLAKNPDQNSQWGEDGYRIDIDLIELSPIISRSQLSINKEELNFYLSSVTNKPFNGSGGVNQGYLYEFSKEAGKFLRNIYGKPFGNKFIDDIFDQVELKMIVPKDPFIASFEIGQFIESLDRSGLYFTNTHIIRFIASLLTKPFLILTGLSGSGKTKLAQAFVQWICEDYKQYEIVPVGADWTNREPLLGYPNALKPEEYVKPDSGVLDLIIRANNQPKLPFFLILDEMNLSHVEWYFADFLSVMESKKDIPLYAEGTVENGVPAKLKLPSNLFIIGTVNIDETTNMFSPKVLDRANTIEFRVSKEDMGQFLSNIKTIDMDELTAKGAEMAESFLNLAKGKSLVTNDMDAINNTLIKFFGELKKTGAEFGYRSATEILRLINQLSVLDGNMETNKKIDIAIMQKLLPKLHGSRRKLCPVLVTLGSFCIEGEVKMEKEVFEREDFDFNGEKVLYPLSLEKIARMYKGAIDNGFASFAEA